MGEEPGKSEAAENSRGGGWPSTRTGSNGGGREGDPGDVRGTLARLSVRPWGSPAIPLSELCFEIHEPRYTEFKEKHIYVKHSCLIWDKLRNCLFVVV